MILQNLIIRTREEHVLFSVLLELTYRCNLDCFFCYNDVGLMGKPLTREEYFELLDDLRDLGTMNLVLSGGEALASPDFFAIGSRARRHGFVIRLKSNGHALRGALARRVREEVDPFEVEISLHGATADVHERQTRVPGSFERLVANLAECKAIGLRIALNSPVTSWNEHQLEEMMDLGGRLGLPIRFDPEVIPRDDGDREPLQIRPSKRALERLYELQEARAAVQEVTVQRDGDRVAGAAPGGQHSHCGAGTASLTVDPYGSVFPCVVWRKPVGNLHDSSIKDIWTGSAVLEEVRADNREVGQMMSGLRASGASVPFCPGHAVREGRQPSELYDDALHRLDAQRTVAAKARSLHVVQ